jgi:type 1 glutamine amidotransferase
MRAPPVHDGPVRLAFAAALGLASLVPVVADAAPGRLLVFSKTAGYRHASIEPAIAALEAIAPARQWTLTTSEDAVAFTDGTLADIDLVLFMMTTDDILDDAEQVGLQTFVEAGGGFVGVHSASATEESWPWYRALLGARFAGHPAPQQATVRVVAADHPACAGLPREWSRFDEWHNFDASPSGTVDVLLQLDETTYDGGTMGADHPIAWAHTFGQARVFYTGGGHTGESWSDPLWLDHVANGIDWVLTVPPSTGDTSTGGGTSEDGGPSGESSSGPVGSGTAGDAETTTAAGTTSGAETSASSSGVALGGDDDGGCGCRGGSAPGNALLLLGLLRRRRRRPSAGGELREQVPAQRFDSRRDRPRPRHQVQRRAAEDDVGQHPAQRTRSDIARGEDRGQQCDAAARPRQLGEEAEVAAGDRRGRRGPVGREGPLTPVGLRPQPLVLGELLDAPRSAAPLEVGR